MLKKFSAAGVMAVAASGALLFAAPANAGVGTSGDGGVLSGNQAIMPVSIPVNVCGNAISVVGISGAGCKGGAGVGAPRHHRHHHGD